MRIYGEGRHGAGRQENQRERAKEKAKGSRRKNKQEVIRGGRTGK